MKVAFVIYSNMTALDFIGVYDPVTRLKSMGFLPDLSWEICAYSETVSDSTGLKFLPTQIMQSLEEFDWVILPGGITPLVYALTQDVNFITWLKTAENCQLKASVCTGSLLLGAAGYLRGKQATSHPNAFKELAEFCAEVVDRRVVDEGNVITARGVTASIDLGLYLCEKVAGYEAKEKIRVQMDYQTEPNSDSSPLYA
ncbi:DJ-1/PfpI family protein [Phormidium sp. CLA17]|uniref:DJ-1/PfpI family protein n=1 Tax=Leptolyngbya sp. Cla-17 TaxID=2803751 RepID=UPI001492D8B4|nr:DJ-1/PfpI family protein [Leptolyngbya sp. Cla-17]MBM0743255.1 DJ-1/PfpI family protein [Leptolyngbya sp. Cla-17]